jgi:hypothetical protein
MQKVQYGSSKGRLQLFNSVVPSSSGNILTIVAGGE